MFQSFLCDTCLDSRWSMCIAVMTAMSLTFKLLMFKLFELQTLSQSTLWIPHFADHVDLVPLVERFAHKSSSVHGGS